MPNSTTLFSKICRATACCVLALSTAGSAHAVVYAFSSFQSGGGGGQDPQKQLLARSRGADVCVDIRQSSAPPGNRVHFTLWSQIPEPKAEVRAFALDTGRHTDLFSNVSILVQSSGAKGKVGPMQPHPFLPRFTPDYAVSLGMEGPLRPGKSIVVAATLASGKTFGNVVSAINEGLNPATAASGLRIGVIVLNLLGGPPPGFATIYDDGGFLMTTASSRCRGR